MSKKTKPFTAEALAAAKTEKAKAEQNVTAADHAFEHGGRTAEQHQRTVAAREELLFHVRVHALAVDEHAAFEREEAARVASEIEAKRLADLQSVNDEIEQNIQASSLAGSALARGLRIGWDLAVRQQGLGGAGHNAWAYSVQNAISQALVAEGINAGLIRVG